MKKSPPHGKLMQFYCCIAGEVIEENWLHSLLSHVEKTGQNDHFSKSSLHG